MLSKIPDKLKFEAWETYGVKLLSDTPKHLPLLQVGLQAADAHPDRAKDLTCMKRAIEMADNLINMIDQKEIGYFFGLKQDKDDPDTKAQKKKLSKEKDM